MTEDTANFLIGLLGLITVLTLCGSCVSCYAVSEAPGIIRAARCIE